MGGISGSVLFLICMIMNEPLQRAVAILKDGGIVAYPTDTVYGLGADAFDEKAVRSIFEVKQRQHNQPLPILLARTDDLSAVADPLPKIALLLAAHFLPGGLTLVVHTSLNVPLWVTAGRDTIAVRVPDHPLAQAMIQGLGRPVVGTSANLSGFPNTVSADEVREQLGRRVDFILDGGNCPGGVESTIIDVTGASPHIIREGVISRNRIEQVLQKNNYKLIDDGTL